VETEVQTAPKDEEAAAQLPLLPWPKELFTNKVKCWCGTRMVSQVIPFRGVGNTPICTNTCYQHMLAAMERAEQASRGLYDGEHLLI